MNSQLFKRSFCQDTQPNLRRSKRGKGKEETDTSFEIKKGRKAPLIAVPKAETSVR